MKDGAAWAALEYTKWAAENGVKGPGVRIIPAAIVYTNKSKYRSSVSPPYFIARYYIEADIGYYEVSFGWEGDILGLMA